MTQQPDEIEPTEGNPDPTEYAPEEPESTDTGTVYEDATGEPAVTPSDETATHAEEPPA